MRAAALNQVCLAAELSETIIRLQAMSKASTIAYKVIKARILAGEFPPNAHLKEEELTRVCGVSRTPVRDALRSLAADYYVKVIPNRGTFVSAWSNEDIEDIFNMRMMLEGYAAQRAAERAHEEQIDKLERYCQNISRLIAASAPIDMEDFLAENRLFHAQLWEASGSERLSIVLDRLVARPVVDRTAIAYTEHDIHRSNEHHKEIVEAVHAHDGQWARSVMHSHIQAAFQMYNHAFKGDAA